MYEGALAFEREILEVRHVIVALVSSEEGRAGRAACFHGACFHGGCFHKVEIGGVFFDSCLPVSQLLPPVSPPPPSELQLLGC